MACSKWKFSSCSTRCLQWLKCVLYFNDIYWWETFGTFDWYIGGTAAMYHLDDWFRKGQRGEIFSKIAFYWFFCFVFLQIFYNFRLNTFFFGLSNTRIVLLSTIFQYSTLLEKKFESSTLLYSSCHFISLLYSTWVVKFQYFAQLFMPPACAR